MIGLKKSQAEFGKNATEDGFKTMKPLEIFVICVESKDLSQAIEFWTNYEEAEERVRELDEKVESGSSEFPYDSRFYIDAVCGTLRGVSKEFLE